MTEAVTADQAVETVVEPVKSGYEGANSYRLANPLTHEGKALMIDGKPVEVLTLRKLRPVELSGINLVDVGMGDVPMVLEMLKRSASPHLGDAAYNLDLPVITEAAGVFKRFFTERQVAGAVMSAP